METSGHIIREYQKADLEKRLYLFLDCPELRNKFMEIETEESRQAPWANKNEAAFPRQAFVWQWLAAVAGSYLKFRRP